MFVLSVRCDRHTIARNGAVSIIRLIALDGRHTQEHEDTDERQRCD